MCDNLIKSRTIQRKG